LNESAINWMHQRCAASTRAGSAAERAFLTPDELLAFGRDVLARLDADGPEPAENDARAKEPSTLRRAEDRVEIPWLPGR
jgi:hypothetical protein